MSDPVSRLLDLHAAGRISDAALDNALRALAPPPPAAAPAPVPVSAAAAVRVMRFEDFSPEEQDQAVRNLFGMQRSQPAPFMPSSISYCSTTRAAARANTPCAAGRI